MLCEKCDDMGFYGNTELFGDVRTSLCVKCTRLWNKVVQDDPNWDEVHSLRNTQVYFKFASLSGKHISLEEIHIVCNRVRELKLYFRNKALEFLGDNNGSD